MYLNYKNVDGKLYYSSNTFSQKFNSRINLIPLLFNLVNFSYRDFSQLDIFLILIFIKFKI